MSVGPLGMMGSLAAVPAQAKAGQVDRATNEATRQARETQANERAEEAAGIGHTEEEQQAGERDADGRRLWERTARNHNSSAEATQSSDTPPKSKDASGESGNQLDLSG